MHIHTESATPEAISTPISKNTDHWYLSQSPINNICKTPNMNAANSNLRALFIVYPPPKVFWAQ
jgi:hypothetical protein